MSVRCRYDDGTEIYSNTGDECPIANNGAELVGIEEAPDMPPAGTITLDVSAPKWPEGLGWLAIILAILYASKKKH